MRNRYAKVLKSFFHEEISHRRTELGFTQEEMACRLAMASRSYVDLDHGKTCCSAITLALYLIYICDNPLDFLRRLKHALEDNEKQAA